MKLYSAQAAMEVALEAVQLFGGNGYMAEYQVEQLCRDAKVAADLRRHRRDAGARDRARPALALAPAAPPIRMPPFGRSRTERRAVTLRAEGAGVCSRGTRTGNSCSVSSARAICSRPRSAAGLPRLRRGPRSMQRRSRCRPSFPFPISSRRGRADTGTSPSSATATRNPPRWRRAGTGVRGLRSGRAPTAGTRACSTARRRARARSRWESAENLTRTVPDVGVGDVFVVAGQSNAVGMTPSLRAAAHPWASVLSLEVFPDGSLFRHADDPLHLAYQWFGSAWPVFMDDVIALTGAPVMMIMTAQGATGLVWPDHWRPRGSRFQRAVANIAVGTGGANRVTAVLYLQGETDAINDVTSEDYKAALIEPCGCIRLQARSARADGRRPDRSQRGHPRAEAEEDPARPARRSRGEPEHPPRPMLRGLGRRRDPPPLQRLRCGRHRSGALARFGAASHRRSSRDLARAGLRALTASARLARAERRLRMDVDGAAEDDNSSAESGARA